MNWLLGSDPTKLGPTLNQLGPLSLDQSLPGAYAGSQSLFTPSIDVDLEVLPEGVPVTYQPPRQVDAFSVDLSHQQSIWLEEPSRRLNGLFRFLDHQNTSIINHEIIVAQTTETISESPEKGPPESAPLPWGDQIEQMVEDHLKHPRRTHAEMQLPHYWSLGGLLVQALREDADLDKSEWLQDVQERLSRFSGLSETEELAYQTEELQTMMRFFLSFTDPAYLERLTSTLTWGHFKLILEVEDPLAREFYAEMAYRRNWHEENILKDEIDSYLFHRSVISRQDDARIRELIDEFKVVETDQIDPLIDLKDLYLFPYLPADLSGAHELHVENLIVEKSSKFRRAMGIGFTAGEKQFYLNVLTNDGERTRDKKVDIFAHWRKIPVLIELKVKTGDITQHVGQVLGYRLLYQELHPEDPVPYCIVLLPEPDEIYYRRIAQKGLVDGVFVSLFAGNISKKEIERICAESIYHSEQRAQQDREYLQGLERHLPDESELEDLITEEMPDRVA